MHVIVFSLGLETAPRRTIMYITFSYTLDRYTVLCGQTGEVLAAFEFLDEAEQYRIDCEGLAA